MSTVLIFAHPDFGASRANRALLTGLEGLPGLEIAALYALYPDGRVDYDAERERLLRAERLVLQFPLQWYSVPSLLKQWADTVLTPLYYVEPDKAAPIAGLPVMAATTAGGPGRNYRADGPNGMTIDTLFAPLRATARRCDWRWQTPFAVYDIRTLTEAALGQAAEDYRAAVTAMPTIADRAQVAP